MSVIETTFDYSPGSENLANMSSAEVCEALATKNHTIVLEGCPRSDPKHKQRTLILRIGITNQIKNGKLKVPAGHRLEVIWVEGFTAVEAAWVPTETPRKSQPIGRMKADVNACAA